MAEAESAHASASQAAARASLEADLHSAARADRFKAHGSRMAQAVLELREAATALHTELADDASIVARANALGGAEQAADGIAPAAAFAATLAQAGATFDGDLSAVRWAFQPPSVQQPDLDGFRTSSAVVLLAANAMRPGRRSDGRAEERIAVWSRHRSFLAASRELAERDRATQAAQRESDLRELEAADAARLPAAVVRGPNGTFVPPSARSVRPGGPFRPSAEEPEDGAFARDESGAESPSAPPRGQ
ncbi:MAG: hypothetical protein ACRENE_25870 [Polyangiaceae bacterium]